MNKTKKLVSLVQLALAIAFIPFNYTQVWALPIKTLLLGQNSLQSSSQAGKKLPIFSQSFQLPNHAVPPPPSDIGAPTRRSHAGSRGCKDSSQKQSSTKTKPLTALAPTYQTKNSESVVWGLTTAEQPHFWFYVPYSLNPNHAMEFVLKDEQENYVYKTKFSGKGTLPGILSIQLPSHVSLKTEQNYSWYFLIYCNSPTPSSHVNGLIKRVQLPKPESQLNSLTPQARAILYASEGIWYDALTELAQLRLVSLQNNCFIDDWIGLLQSVGLGEFALESLISCCYY